MTKKKDKKAKEQRKKLYARIDADGSRGVTPDEVYAAVQKMWPEFDSMEVSTVFFALCEILRIDNPFIFVGREFCVQSG